MATPTLALVVGGGIGGLVTARVLSPHYARVLIVDQDQLSTDGDPSEGRKGIPQGPHQHVLVAEGRRLLESLFPGLDDTLAAAGCEIVDWGAQCFVVSPAGPVPGFPSKLVTRPCTRPFLEHHLRRRVFSLPNVEVRSGVSVNGLVLEGSRVTGIQTRDGETLLADLVVDATGRPSKAPDWLAANGYAPPTETIVDAHLAYASRYYRRPEKAPGAWNSILISTRAPDNPRAAGLFPVEGNRWTVTLAGTAREYPPTDEAGFLEFARALLSPVLYEAIRDAEPLSPIRGFRNTSNRWRHFERLARLPERFVVVGDGVCAFNPIYAQGMTVAVQEAMVLGRLVARARAAGRVPGDGNFVRDYFRGLPPAIMPGWLIATGEDCRWPATEGPRGGLGQRFLHWYVDRLMELTPRSPRMVNAFLSVTHMIRTPASLFHPAVAVPVLLHAANPFSKKGYGAQTRQLPLDAPRAQ